MDKLVLVTGATGYVGGRLISKLINMKYKVRVLARNPSRLENKTWYNKVEIHHGDVLDKNSLIGLFKNVDTAYYLIHSMSNFNNFDEKDIKAAKIFSKIADEEKLNQIIYLGGLADNSSDLSKHLRSRLLTGDELRKSKIKIIEFRASVIVGSGSLSFEMIRNLTERIPVMICPKWVYTRTQPISIKNVIEYLVSSLSIEFEKNMIFEIGGKDVLSYGDMIKQYAKIRNLKRLLIPIPILTPKLSSYWVHWTTPLSANITRPLVEGLKNESIIKSNNSSRSYFKKIKLLNYKEALNIALNNLKAGNVETSWSDSLSSSNREEYLVDLKSKEGLLIERRNIYIKSNSKNIFSFILTLGGKNGWLYGNFLWRMRGYIDLLVGGVGLRRGRRNPVELKQGDALDFWRVEKIISNKLLRLKAEMKLPGIAWLQYEIVSISDTKSELIQTAYFASKGLGGLLYWYILYPIHQIIFSGLIKTIKKKIELNEIYKA